MSKDTCVVDTECLKERKVVMDKLNREELESSFKEMVLNTIEAIIKHNNKAGDMIRGGDYSKEDVALFHKKLLNLVHILYPVRNIARMFIQSEHPEYVYILDYVEKVYVELETPVLETLVLEGDK